MKSISKTTHISVILAISLLSSSLTAQDNSEAVKVSFQNPQESMAVQFRLYTESDKEDGKAVPTKLNDDDQPLEPGNQRTFRTYPGLVWQIVDAETGKPIAVYVTSGSETQNVNIGEVISATAPVTLKFNNTTEASINVFQMGERFSDISIVAGVYSSESLEGSLVRIPGDKLRWTSGAQVSEYQMDTTTDDETLSASNGKSEEDKLVFSLDDGVVQGLTIQGKSLKRTGDTSIGILVLENIDAGVMTDVILDENGPGPMPGSEWQIQQNGSFYADYTADSSAVQEVDVLEVGTWFVPVTAVFKNDSSSRVKVYFVDISGEEIPVMLDKDDFVIPLKSDEWVSLPSRPYYQYRVVDNNNSDRLVEFSIDNQPEQIFKITDELLNAKQQEDD